MLSDLRRRHGRSGVTRAVAERDTPALFDWLMQVLSYQGVSDAIAFAYMDRHGTVNHADVTADLGKRPVCPKLRSFWHFAECGFAKQAFTCRRPEHIERCPLPLPDLRSGRLNQAAFSLFLFLRDVCGGDFVGWIDDRLAIADEERSNIRSAGMRAAVLEPLACIYGVSSKVLSWLWPTCCSPAIRLANAGSRLERA